MSIYGLGFTTLYLPQLSTRPFRPSWCSAAQVDGASFFQIFRRILLPTSAPIIVVIRHLPVHQYLERLPVRLAPYAGTGESTPMTVALNNLVSSPRPAWTNTMFNMRRLRCLAAVPTLVVYVARRPLFRARPDGRRRQGVASCRFLEISGLRKTLRRRSTSSRASIWSSRKADSSCSSARPAAASPRLLNTIAGLEPITSGDIAHRRPHRSTGLASLSSATLPWCSSPTRSIRT